MQRKLSSLARPLRANATPPPLHRTAGGKPPVSATLALAELVSKPADVAAVCSVAVSGPSLADSLLLRPGLNPAELVAGARLVRACTRAASGGATAVGCDAPRVVSALLQAATAGNQVQEAQDEILLLLGDSARSRCEKK